MSEEVKAITVPVPATTEDMVVVVASTELLESINTLSIQAAALAVIRTDVEAEAAGALLKLVTGLEKEVEENATAANKPYYEIQKAISAAKASVAKPLASIKAGLKDALKDHLLKREKERMLAEMEAMRKRQEEAKAVAEFNAQRALAAATAGAPAPAPMAVPSEVLTLKPAVASAAAVSISKKMVVHIVDEDKVPRAYCAPDVKLVEAAWKRGEITPELHTFFRVEEVTSVRAK